MRLWAVGFSTLFLSPLWAGHTLTAEHQKVLAAWLAANSQYRAATDADCSCAEEIRDLKGGFGDPKFGVPDYHPYQATGDFNGDGRVDFAVVLINRTNTTDWAVAVFNAPFSDGKPAYLKSGFRKEESALFYFTEPRPKPWKLWIGPFNSDAAVEIAPYRSGYRIVQPKF